jgi:cellobiose phosphorylase
MLGEHLRDARQRVATLRMRVRHVLGRDRSPQDDQTPLRAELFSADQMEQHGRVLAEAHSLHRAAGRDRLLQRLDDNERVLTTTCRLLTAVVLSKIRITPAGEWLLDNFYLVEEQIRAARKHLPQGYSRELPRLAAGPSAGLPRVYDLALEAISHGDGRVDTETLARFVTAYQSVTPLMLGELWAIPIMLRLALIENLRRVAARINTARLHANQAGAWADQMMEVAQSDPKSLILVIADMARSDPPMSSPFVAELARRLQGHGPSLAWPLTWVEQRLAESSLTIEQMVVSENQRQAADQVSISNSIGSLRFLGATDWREFVERMSGVERVLRSDPGGAYGRMDFLTRDRYRVAVDRLAKRSACSETEVAEAAVRLAQGRAQHHGSGDRRSHVGFFLIDEGYPILEDAVQARLSIGWHGQRFAARHPLGLYLGAIGLFTLAAAAAMLYGMFEQGVDGWPLAALGVVVVIAASQFASALTNWLATLVVRPARLPRLDFTAGLPEDMRTLVVIPSLLQGRRATDELLEALEVRFLGNQDPQISFALLTDFQDGAAQVLPQDAALLEHARQGIDRLNEKYRPAGDDRFHLLHRTRRWNPAERCWMGFERKRGKLAALNAFLRDGARDPFALVVGNPAALRRVRYVITLDTDTRLPRDTARHLVAAMAHPLNRPQRDETTRTIVAGYGILQPGMATSLSRARRSRYARLCGSEPGIDPYTHSVSDVYQDLFREGSFIGKGIYDVDAFEFALRDRLPCNRILSHDLLEGCYARSGLLSDVQLSEAYPSSYLADVERHGRWIRGDWQIAQWARARVPAPAGPAQPNPLSPLSRWKILDNLRRSLSLACLAALLPLAWTLLPLPGAWTLAVLSVFLVPSLLVLAVALLRPPQDVLLRSHVEAALAAAREQLALAGFRVACLPFEAVRAVEAILRTLWRMAISQRHLLEWRASGDPTAAPRPGLAASARAMAFGPFAGIVTLAALVAWRPYALAAAMPVLVLWFSAPVLAWWLSRPVVPAPARLGAEQERFLRRNARKTWAFFERFVTPDDHWLPPDNFQEEPGPIVAHRTSPTNMGLALLANLSASDLGYLSMGTLLDRTQCALETMGSMERYQGHFFNWYDTQTLQPLRPRYISSVDSGNLAGHLLTLGAGLRALVDEPAAGAHTFEGLADTLDCLAKRVPGGDAGADLRRQLGAMRKVLGPLRILPPERLSSMRAGLERLAVAASVLRVPAGVGQGKQEDEAAYWIVAVQVHCREALAQLRRLSPWLDVPAPPAGITLAVDPPAAVTLRELARLRDVLAPSMAALEGGDASPERLRWLADLRRSLDATATTACEEIGRCERLAAEADGLAAMDYEFLYDRTRRLLSIGYNVDEFRRDASFYDLLASEARLCAFVAIAQGHVPQESWFALGRLLRIRAGDPILVSWSGSMFEYLMPLLVMPTYEGTLLDQTCRGAVRQQIAYGNQRSLPWGVSESGYNTVDIHLNYQYHAFGIPGLGLKRGLAEDSVVAPYACAMALMLDPEQACGNLLRLADAGLEGPFGFYEAIDYTPVRLPRGQSSAIVRSFMAHHQGMILLALAHHLMHRPMQRRFESVPSFQATLLLLQERIPKTLVVREGLADDPTGGARAHAAPATAEAPMRADTPTPEVQLLSNGRYHVMVTNSGGGYSRWRDLALTRWREDATCDSWGSFLYVRDVESGEFWSAGFHPTRRRAERYEAMFSEGRAEFRRLDHELETYTEFVVSPEDDIELRRIRIGNRARRHRVVEVTSYAEVVLAAPAADLMHPGFGNLFVQTRILPEQRAIVCTRRPRSVGEAVPWMFHLFAVHGTDACEVSYETDRMRFIGRGRDLANPRALTEVDTLSGTDGSVLDPIIAIRCRTALDAQQSVTIDVVTGIAETREACLALIDKYRDRHLADRVFDLAMTHSGVILRQIDATPADAQLYRRLAGSILYANAALRAPSEILVQNRRGQSGLWGYSISGDLPIVLLTIGSAEHIDLVRRMIQCHVYWRLKGLKADLVIWNEENASYRARLQEQIMGLVANGVEANAMNRPGGIFVRASAEQVSSEDRILLHSVARAVLSGERGTLDDQIQRRGLAENRSPRLIPTRVHRPEPPAPPDPLPAGLVLGNGLGGFSADATEYLIHTARSCPTPAPWANVIANARFGTVITESGNAYTWSENAHEFRLTPWSDDGVGTGCGEAIYLRDEESGFFWSPTSHPSSGAMPYATRHGFGWSVFEHTSGGIRSELCVYVDPVETVKFSVLTVRNGSGRMRRLSATGYVEWVLGDVRSKCAMHICTQIDAASGAMFAHNAYNADFAGRVAFFDVDDASRTLSGDRSEFIGRNGSLGAPEAMTRTLLSGRLGAALDPCGAIRVPFDLADGQERQIIFRLGAGEDLDGARALALRLRQAGAARQALQRVHQYWRRTLGAIQVSTPDPAVNALANGWLVYQTLSCRFWARSGYYQSGGAFGFRDQLQDAMALVHAQPALVREHLLRCAARQYREGDVQHWWHPPSGRGVRTRCSDDYLWLPLAVCRYVKITGDAAVLDEQVNFLDGRALGPEEESYYDVPGHTTETASLYAHCVLAIEHGLRFGVHGLPLMGSGDWNDGMNLVGIEGRGESVWLGFFLHALLGSFAALAERAGDAAFARRCHDEAERLQLNLERHAWDGQWYRRAYFDDATPLGSRSNPECQIDSLAQSWAALSGAGDAARVRLALGALDDRLVDRDHRLVRLLDPPFDVSDLNPGYIKGYVPGVRENGGQYTHAAVWAAMAFAALGDGRRAWELLSMILPTNHARQAAEVDVYRTEPYVVAADVYSCAPHAGRGGWTWYTGAAGWLYRLIVESILGMQREGACLRVRPCLPPHWNGFEFVYRYGETRYHIRMTRASGGDGLAPAGAGPGAAPSYRVRLDGVLQADGRIKLVDDHLEHAVEVHAGSEISRPLLPATPS